MPESGIKRFCDRIFGKKSAAVQETPADPQPRSGEDPGDGEENKEVNVQKAEVQETGVQKAEVQETGVQKAGVQKAEVQEADVQKADDQKEGIQYTKDPTRNGMILTKYGDPIEKRVVLPEMVDGLPLIEIGKAAFSGHKDLEEIVLPDTVVTIGQAAFAFCQNLKSVILPKNLETIQKGAFAGCLELKQVKFPESLKKIEESAFWYCEMGECIIPDSVTEIQAGAFSDSGLLSINIPASCVSLGEKVFLECRKLTSILVDGKNPVYASLDGVLYDREKKRLLCYPFAKEGKVYSVHDGTEEIAERAFFSNRNLEELRIPGTVKRIGEMAVGECMALKKVILSDGLEEIERSAFQYSRFEECRIPETVKKISSCAFGSCLNLKKVYLPAGCTCIEDFAFSECRSLTEITVADGNPSFVSIDGVLYDLEQKSLVQYPPAKVTTVLRIPEGIERIGSCAIRDTRLERLELPSSFRQFGGHSFTLNMKLSEIWYKGTLSRWNKLDIPKDAFYMNGKKIGVKFW